jgi:hypothetical protein
MAPELQGVLDRIYDAAAGHTPTQVINFGVALIATGLAHMSEQERAFALCKILAACELSAERLLATMHKADDEAEMAPHLH